MSIFCISSLKIKQFLHTLTYFICIYILAIFTLKRTTFTVTKCVGRNRTLKLNLQGSHCNLDVIARFETRYERDIIERIVVTM